MSQFPSSRPSVRVLDYARGGSVVASFMNAVYAWMCCGLAMTAVVAWYVARQVENDPTLIQRLFNGGTLLVLILVELALVFVISAATQRISATVATGLFLLYAGLNGVTLSAILLVYTHSSVAGAFLVTAGMFGGVSLYGWVTKRDLSGMGGFLLMALIGLILASIVNIFIASSAMYWVITYSGVLIFVGLTAYDTQKLKSIAMSCEGNIEMARRMAIIGSLSLYLDFINLFIYILRIMGKRK